jgi:transposase
MRCERGVFWTDYRQGVVRQLLRQGYGREVIALRLGITRPTLKEAIRRFNLDDRPEQPGQGA